MNIVKKEWQKSTDNGWLCSLGHHKPLSVFASVFCFFRWQKWQMNFKIFFVKVVYGRVGNLKNIEKYKKEHYIFWSGFLSFF